MDAKKLGEALANKLDFLNDADWYQANLKPLPAGNGEGFWVPTMIFVTHDEMKTVKGPDDDI
jgi:hypothetical protein